MLSRGGQQPPGLGQLLLELGQVMVTSGFRHRLLRFGVRGSMLMVVYAFATTVVNTTRDIFLPCLFGRGCDNMGGSYCGGCATFGPWSLTEMSLATLDPPMSDEKPKTMSVKMPIDVIESARIVSAFRGETMTELMADILRPALAKMEQEEMSRRQAAAK